MNSSDQPSNQFAPPPFSELKNPNDQIVRVLEVIEMAREMAEEVGIKADYFSLISQLQLELDVTADEAAAWLELLDIGPEQESEDEEEEEKLVITDDEFARVLAMIATMPEEEEATGAEEPPPTPTESTPASTKPPRKLGRFDHLKR